MTEEKENQEQQAQVPQMPVKEQVRLLRQAYELAGIANGYKATMEISKRETAIYVNDGKNMRNDPTLAEYILKAEREFILQHSDIIIELAKDLLAIDIEEIRGLVNG